MENKYKGEKFEVIFVASCVSGIINSRREIHHSHTITMYALPNCERFSDSISEKIRSEM